MRWTRRWTMVLFAAAVLPAQALAIPAFARKYNMNCNGCHYPVVPQLNAQGLRFKWAGYRMPDEIEQAQEVKRIEDYLAAHGTVQYSYAKTENEKADENGFGVPSASLFAAGSLGKYFGGFFEFERDAEGAAGGVTSLTSIWGSEKTFGGVRFEQGDFLFGGAVAGFDRSIGPNAPLALDGPTTFAAPFAFAGDYGGLEASLVMDKKNRASLGVVNGTAVDGSQNTKKDFFVTDQFIWDDNGGGIGAVAYFGNAEGLDPDLPDQTAHFYRIAASADHYFGPFGALAGYVYSKDSRLPVGGNSPFATSSLTGSSYWLSGEWIMPEVHFTLYGRYEHLDPDTKTKDDALRRIVLGGVLPINVPEYLRFGLEYFHDSPQPSAAPTRQGITAEAQLAF